MSKTLLKQNKEAIAGVAVIAGLIILAVVNLSILIPSLLDVYEKGDKSGRNDPIDAQTVNQAINLLSL
jgi:hypothetical protein